MTSTIEPALASVVASPSTLALLRELHTAALTEPAYVSTDEQPASVALERFVALEPDKCALVYLLLRASGARHVVEAGTSFGVSTIYLALAVGQNGGGKVIATENEPVKAARAREHWRRTGENVEKWIELREGDICETLKADLPEKVDALLLDIWAVLAMPTLALVKPRLRIGALVIVDNVIAGAAGYKDLLLYLDDPNNGFRSTTAPYPGGLCVAVYVGDVNA
ncbi:S-adenosyl-L-methionine-dependent methyltransferase [Mycena pura]|uniref:S-adenosyl-L-methionine-dependent methyltransferase n=1 Tax=Mycena pura TaxID=153505 RepID=A0AAD6YUN0_9AGAR|nr:S-adenosyl-L-methionine-dependent methyltransferase [Mycena pura]